MDAPVMPDKAWLEEPEIFDAMGFWQERQSAGLTEYIRADLHCAALATETARADAAEAAIKTAREEIVPILHLLEDGLTDFGFKPGGKFRTYVNSILALIKEPRP